MEDTDSDSSTDDPDITRMPAVHNPLNVLQYAELLLRYPPNVLHRIIALLQRCLCCCAPLRSFSLYCVDYTTKMLFPYCSLWSDTAVLLLRDAVHKCGLCCRSVSIRLSNWSIVSIRLKMSSNSFLCLVAHFSFLDHGHRYPFPRGVHSTGVQSTREWEKSAMFD